LQFPLPAPVFSSNLAYHGENLPNPASRQTYWEPSVLSWFSKFWLFFELGIHIDCILPKKGYAVQCRLEVFFGLGYHKLLHDKAHVNESIWSQSHISRSFLFCTESGLFGYELEVELPWFWDVIAGGTEFVRLFIYG